MFEKPKRQFSAVLGMPAPSDEWIVIFGTCPSYRSAIFVDHKRRRSVSVGDVLAYLSDVYFGLIG